MEPERRVLLHNIEWDAYVSMREQLIARLLEAWALERNVDLNGYGGMTFRKKAKKRGLEPDECYSIGRMGAAPDIAIEIVLSSPLIDKLDVYAGLGVLEVWVYENTELTVHRLVGKAYEPQRRSEVLPALDLGELASFVEPDVAQTSRVRAYLEKLRAG